MPVATVPEDTVIRIPYNEESQQSVGDMEVKNKVKRVSLSNIIKHCLSKIKGAKYRGRDFINDGLDSVNSRVCVRGGGVPRSVQISTYRLQHVCWHGDIALCTYPAEILCSYPDILHPGSSWG